MRLAQRQIRFVVADCPHCSRQDGARQEPEEIGKSHGGLASDEEDRNPRFKKSLWARINSRFFDGKAENWYERGSDPTFQKKEGHYEKHDGAIGCPFVGRHGCCPANSRT